MLKYCESQQMKDRPRKETLVKTGNITGPCLKQIILLYTCGVEFYNLHNTVAESGVHPPLQPNCHNQIVFAKFNLKIYHPPQYLREVWHCKEASADLIKQSVNNSNWEKALCNTSINEKVSISNKMILNVLNNYIPHEMIICDGKDPPWFTSRIKYLIESKNKLRNNNYGRLESNSHLLSTLNKSS